VERGILSEHLVDASCVERLAIGRSEQGADEPRDVARMGILP
jgi:hypothetical protein